jgi:hypothetical protein
MGGILKSAPGASELTVAVRGADDQLWYRTFVVANHVAGSWGPWETLGGALTSAPAIAYPDVYIRGRDGQLWHRQFGGGTADESWEPLGGVLTSDLAATTL